MSNPHYESEAENHHVIGTDLFTNKFERRQLKILRIYLKQPSPSWLDFTLNEIQVFMKKTETQNISAITKPVQQQNSFDQFKSQIKRNIKNMKKDND